MLLLMLLLMRWLLFELLLLMLLLLLVLLRLPLLLTRTAKGAMERAALQGTATAENMDAAAAGVAWPHPAYKLSVNFGVDEMVPENGST